MITLLVRLAADSSRRGSTRLSQTLCAWARVCHWWVHPRGLPVMPRVAHVSHAYFSPDSYVGGGERYATDLATAMLERARPVLLTFGRTRESLNLKGLPVEVFPSMPAGDGRMPYPATSDFVRILQSADVIHVHQYQTRLTALAVIVGASRGIPVFATDCGGWEMDAHERFDFDGLLAGVLGLSKYSIRQLPLSRRSAVIYGGVAAHFLVKPSTQDKDPRLVVCVARLMPHKGIDVLINALDSDMRLECHGQPYNGDYVERLKVLAAGKQVIFHTDSDDAALSSAYQRARVTVLASVHRDVYGRSVRIPELLGLTLLESMATGTPVICSDAGALPEIVEDGVTGFVVPWGDAGALRARLRQLCDNPSLAAQMGAAGRARVLERYTWDKIADRCLAAYQEFSS